jgi:uncharacterized tellurite resistance protein B-like protein
VFERLIENLGHIATIDDSAQARDPETQLAAAMLLYAVMPADRVVLPEESVELRFAIQHIFGLSDARCQKLISRAVSIYDREPTLLAPATILKHRISTAFRRLILTSAYRIAMADGRMHAYEADVLARMSSLMGLNEPERNERLTA